MHLESRGGSTALPIERVKIVMRYTNPPGDTPDGINHGEIPVVDWPVRTTLNAGDHMIGPEHICALFAFCLGRRE